MGEPDIIGLRKYLLGKFGIDPRVEFDMANLNPSQKTLHENLR